MHFTLTCNEQTNVNSLYILPSKTQVHFILFSTNATRYCHCKLPSTMEGSLLANIKAESQLNMPSWWYASMVIQGQEIMELGLLLWRFNKVATNNDDDKLVRKCLGEINAKLI
jgi:hypothetical protein